MDRNLARRLTVLASDVTAVELRRLILTVLEAELANPHLYYTKRYGYRPSGTFLTLMSLAAPPRRHECSW
jgi:hypothetical protein